MTIAEAVNQADKLCPNTTFSMNEKIAWLNRLDKQIKLEIMDLCRVHGENSEYPGTACAVSL
ncbi:MAG: hypothetical protein BHV98_03135 [Clostridium sp. CAG:217_53_7]|nr:MAG: hypothetical protein BHV98_03135 [Clostridium sp. CAG:217_53_7]